MSNTVHDLMNEWMDKYGIQEKKEPIEKTHYLPQQRINYLKAPIQKTLDLHGFTIDYALTELQHFLVQCQKRGIKKILIIHGKGLHSPNGPILKKEVHLLLNSSPLVKKTGYPGKENGGTGAVWAILR